MLGVDRCHRKVERTRGYKEELAQLDLLVAPPERQAYAGGNSE